MRWDGVGCGERPAEHDTDELRRFFLSYAAVLNHGPPELEASEECDIWLIQQARWVTMRPR